MKEIDKIFLNVKQLFLNNFGNTTKDYDTDFKDKWDREDLHILELVWANENNIKYFKDLLNNDIREGSIFGLFIYYYYTNFLETINNEEFISLMNYIVEGYDKSSNKELYSEYFNQIWYDSYKGYRSFGPAEYIFELHHKIISLKNEIILLKNHIQYQPGGLGYEEAKKRFSF